jgi:ABC-type dipeptide/oligopeptide/nickel transport system ATPase component
VAALAHDVIVMKDGDIVEAGPARRLLASPTHPYTRTLLASAATPVN